MDHRLVKLRQGGLNTSPGGSFSNDSTAREVLSHYTSSKEIKVGDEMRRTSLRSGLLRYEMGGVIVYDSRARFFDDIAQRPPKPFRTLSPLQEREFESPDHAGSS